MSDSGSRSLDQEPTSFKNVAQVSSANLPDVKDTPSAPASEQETQLVTSEKRASLWQTLCNWKGTSLTGLLIGLGALGWSVYSSPSHKLAWGVDSVSQLISSKVVTDSRLKIQFDSQPIADVALVVLRLTNMGNQAIDKQSFDRLKLFGLAGLEATFDPTTRVLSTKFGSSEPVNRPDLDEPKSVAASAVIPAVSLNPGEYVTVECLVSPSPKSVDFRGHITGVEFAPVEKFIQAAYYTNWGCAACCFFGMLALLSSYTLLVTFRKSVPLNLVLLSMIVLAFGIFGSKITAGWIDKDMHGKRFSSDLDAALRH